MVDYVVVMGAGVCFLVEEMVVFPLCLLDRQQVLQHNHCRNCLSVREVEGQRSCSTGRMRDRGSLTELGTDVS